MSINKNIIIKTCQVNFLETIYLILINNKEIAIIT